MKNRLATIFRLLRIAKATDTKYLMSINLQALQKTKGKPGPGDNPRDFYQALQQEAAKGPIFAETTLKFIDSLPMDLQKDEAKWLATRLQKKARIDVRTLQNVLDYLRAEKPALEKLTYRAAVQNTARWHEQFKGKEESAGPYKTKKVVLQTENYAWVEVPVEDLKTEGDLMGHCVGGADYADEVKRGKTKIFSLRDAKNGPHVTIEITNGKLVQVQGKQNEAPILKYHAHIRALLSHFKLPECDVSLSFAKPERLTELSKGSASEREKAASSAGTPPEVLASLSKDGDHDVLIAVAENINTPPATLSAMAKNGDPNVREQIAYNSSTPHDTLSLLVRDKRIMVRKFLAGNKAAPLNLLLKLTKDSDYGVRSTLAMHPNIDEAISKVLVRDKEKQVRGELARNPKLSPKFLVILSKDASVGVKENVCWNSATPLEALVNLSDSIQPDIRAAIAKHPNVSVELLIKLSRDTATVVRKEVAANDKTPVDILKTMLKDRDPHVKRRAGKNLERRQASP